MVSHLKKTISVVLLFIFLYNISGYYLAFTFQQSGIKETVQDAFKEGETDDLLVLRISPAEEKNMTWNGSEEFSLNGKMYDVAFSKREGNILYLYCYCDSKENQLFASLNLHVKNNIDFPGSRKNSKNTLKNPLPNYFMNSSKNELSFFVYILKKEIQCSFHLLSFSLDTPAPPPRLA
jgi:hypothetical protein